MVSDPKVFDITKVHLWLTHPAKPAELGEVTEMGTDGFGVTPTAEHTLIDGLKGEVGLNVDPKSGCEGTINLKSTSPWNAALRAIKNEQNVGNHTPMKVEVIVDDDFVDAFGFAKKTVLHAFITKWPEFATDEKESPNMEWGFVGYGYSEV